MSEHLNDEEIALELTKTYIEHMNHNVDLDRTHTKMDAHGVAASYQVMLNAVMNPNTYLQPSKKDKK